MATLALSLALGFPALAKDDAKPSDYPKFTKADAEGIRQAQIYRVNPAQVHPTQFAVGREEVETRKARIAKMGKKAYREYLHEKIGSVVIGPGGEPWLVDGHHLATALDELGEKAMLVKVLYDWSDLSEEEFFRRMRDPKFSKAKNSRYGMMWLYDEHGQARPVSELPRRPSELGDDLFRTLAWKIEDAGGYHDLPVPFQEFIWANWLRKLIPEEELRAHPKRSLKLALTLVHDARATGMPGYISMDELCELTFAQSK